MKLSSRSTSGFTLIEVVLAMGILLLGLSVILALLSFGASLARSAGLRSSSARAIERVSADLEERLFPLVQEDGREVVGDPLPIVDRALGGPENLVYSALPRAAPEPSAPGAPLEYRVDIAISWTSSGVRRERSYQLLLLREVPFGERLRRRFLGAENPAAAPPR